MQVSPALRRTALSAGLGFGTAGTLAAIVLLGPLAATILLAVVFVLTWPLAAVIRYLADEVPYGSAVRVAFLAAAGVLCLPGLVRLAGWGTVGLAIGLIFAVLFVLVDLIARSRLLSPRRRPEYDEAAHDWSQYGAVARLSQDREVEDERLIASLRCPLSIEELCEVWTETVTTLARAGDRDRQAVAEVRRICLDEFERRNPDGFRRWLAAGAPADPARYLLPLPGE